MIFYIFVGIVIAIVVFVHISIFLKRQKKDYREHIDPFLRKLNLKFISSVYPGMFKTGPFPKFEIETGASYSRAGSVKGEHFECRIVTFSDNSKTYQLWAMLEFVTFKLNKIRWRKDQNQTFPKAMEQFIENINS